jgi:hypothetical protein
MNKLTPFWTVMISIMLLSVVINLIMLVIPIEEMFGTQGGTNVQLQTSHVPTLGDLDDLKKEQLQIKKDIIEMTGYW